MLEPSGNIAPEPAVADLTARAIKMLEGQGAQIETPAVPEFANVFDTYVVIATTGGFRSGFFTVNVTG